jgi:hypothetical protein
MFFHCKMCSCSINSPLVWNLLNLKIKKKKRKEKTPIDRDIVIFCFEVRKREAWRQGVFFSCQFCEVGGLATIHKRSLDKFGYM